MLENKSSGTVTLVDIPKIYEMLAKLRLAKFFTCLDLRSGYYKLSLETRHKSEFTTIFGNYKFLRIPFRLAQSLTYFTTLMQKVFGTLHDFHIIYMDDVLMQDSKEKDHLKHLKMIFKKIREVRLKLKLSK